MPRCPDCGFRLPGDRNRVGARCPHCRSPLYQPPGRFPREAADGEAACVVHPGNVSVGACGRCGNFLCDTCRTRWDDLVLCAACVDRAVRAGDITLRVEKRVIKMNESDFPLPPPTFEFLIFSLKTQAEMRMLNLAIELPFHMIAAAQKPASAGTDALAVENAGFLGEGAEWRQYDPLSSLDDSTPANS